MAVLPVVYENNEHRVGTLSELLVVSTAASNLLTFNTDGGLFIDGNAILSNGEASNLLVISHTDQKIYLSDKILTDAGFVNGVSQDSGNLLSLGSDGNPIVKISDLQAAGVLTMGELTTRLNELGYVTSTTLSAMGFAKTSELAGLYATRSELSNYPTRTEVSSMISAAGSGSSSTVTPSNLISSTTGNLLTTGTDGKLLVTSTGDGGSASPTTLAPNLLSKDAASGYGNLLTVGSDGLLLVPNDCGELD